MQKKALLILLIFISSISYSQIFTEQTDIVIPGVLIGSVDWGDYNNDGLLDFMMTGRILSIDGVLQYYSAVYKNKGNNVFEEITGVFEDVTESSLSWGDYNNDNFIDILLSGFRFEDKTLYTFSEIYKNNTDKTFSLQDDINFKTTGSGEFKWGDYNNDGYNDALQCGITNYGETVLNLYNNNGDNTFSNFGFWIKGKDGSLDWGDYDNDGFLDFIITGRNTVTQETRIFKNQGDTTFIEQTQFNIENIMDGSVGWGDYNNDGFLDILISGINEKWEEVTKIYKNIKGSDFEELLPNSLSPVYLSSVVWGDYNNDGLLDIFITGSNSGVYTSELYENNGDETFSENENINIIPLKYSSTRWGDYDNDNDLDILLCGVYGGAAITSKIYKNNTPTPNSPPNVITNLKAEIKGNDVFFSWDEATDNNQPSAGLNYNIYVYDEDNRKDILAGIPHEHQFVASPQAFIQNHPLNGKRLLAQRGHIQGIRKDGRVSYFLKGVFDNCKKYYWSVQAIDASFAGGQFAPEASFIFDNTAPEITCPTNQTIEIPQEQTTYTVQGNELDPVNYSDNCTYTIIENDYNFAETLHGEELPKGKNTFEWMVTDTVGNTAQCSFGVEVLGISKIKDVLSNGIEVYPNPSNGTFTIIFPLKENNKNTSLRIKDITGKQIFSSEIKNQSQTTINLKSYPKGIYFLSLTNLSFYKTTKIIIQ